MEEQAWTQEKGGLLEICFEGSFAAAEDWLFTAHIFVLNSIHYTTAERVAKLPEGKTTILIYKICS